MKCPYCESEYGLYDGILDTEYQGDYVILTRTVVCMSCKEEYVERSTYIECGDYENMTMNEWKKRSE